MKIFPHVKSRIIGKIENAGYDAVIEHEWLWWKWERQYIGDCTVWYSHKTQRRASTSVECELAHRLAFYKFKHGEL